MEENLFNEEIRKKLESIEVITNESDWDKFNSFNKFNSKNNTALVFKNKYNFIFISAFLTLAGYTYSQYKMKIELKKKNEELSLKNNELIKKTKEYEKKIDVLYKKYEELSVKSAPVKAISSNQININKVFNNKKKIIRLKKIKNENVVKNTKLTFFKKVKKIISNLFNGREIKSKQNNKFALDSLVIIELIDTTQKDTIEYKKNINKYESNVKLDSSHIQPDTLR